MEFKTIEEAKDYKDFLEMKGKPIPQSLLDEIERLERESNINPDEFIYSTMAAHNPFMTEEKDTVVRNMVGQLMSDADNAAQPCLLLGKVQCGKTDTFLSIMGLCFDRGIDVAVVMTKGTNTLTKQTIKRLNNDFRFFKDNGTYNQKVIISVWDILDLGHRGGFSDYELSDPASKFIIVCKKEDKNLGYLNEIFDKSEALRGKKILVCDDEADFASRAYYKNRGTEHDLSLMKISEHIENFIKKPGYCRYLQITATPYSLFLQPDGSIQLREGEEASPWLPRYTGLVPIHDHYIGGRQYYDLSEDENSMYNSLYQEVNPDCIDVLAARNEFFLDSNVYSEALDSLNYCIVSYLFGAAVRSLQQKKKNKKYYSSCLIHCEVNKKKHQWQEEVISKIIDSIKNAFLNKANADLHILDLERDAYESLKHSNELGCKYELISEKFPTFGEVEAEVKRILEYNDYTVNVVNSEEPVSTMLNEKGQLRLDRTMNFFIGGSILDRGITIDNMLSFFYGRDPKKFQMDTVLQHARMYGSRSKEDMACTRFFTTDAIYDVLKTINSIDEMMYNYIRKHSDKLQTDDFISMVMGYDGRINLSAANKYTPANTKVMKPYQRILPKGFQTGDADAIAETISQIDQIIEACPGYKDVTDDDPFFLMDYETAVKIINLVSSTYLYGKEYNNVGYEWDQTEMITALDHCVFETDGKIYCQVCKDRNMSRERENIYDKRGRFIDSPESGATNAIAKDKAIDRPVLTLLRQNGSSAKGWRDTPFYWPSLMLHRNLVAGMFTINSNKKYKAPKKQFHLSALDKYPKEEVLILTTAKQDLFEIINKEKFSVVRDIKTNTSSLFLERDIMGNDILIEGVDTNQYYDLSTYNGGVFPYEVKKYKYLYLKSSPDFSGSQVLVKLNEEKPYEMVAEPWVIPDVVYDQFNEGREAYDEKHCLWQIHLNLGDILEQKLTPQDEEAYQTYLEFLEMMLEGVENNIGQ